MIDGCYWACPYELVFCRFDSPLSLPWPELDRIVLYGEPEGWTRDGFVYESTEEIRITDGKPWHELSKVGKDELHERWSDIGGERIRRCLRGSDGSNQVLNERVERGL